MGMYTGFRFKGLIKKEYRSDIAKMLEIGGWESSTSQILIEFNKVLRSTCIPFGSLACMSDHWEERNANGFGTKDGHGFGLYFNNDTGLLCFQCSLKNYKSTIECFISCTSIICDKLIHCESIYEEDDVSTLYELVDGALERLDYGIIYDKDDHILYKDSSIYYEDFDFTKENEYRQNYIS